MAPEFAVTPRPAPVEVTVESTIVASTVLVISLSETAAPMATLPEAETQAAKETMLAVGSTVAPSASSRESVTDVIRSAGINMSDR